MRSFKAHLSSTATRAYASEIMQGLELQGRILKKPDLRIQLISFIASAVECMREAERCVRG